MTPYEHQRVRRICAEARAARALAAAGVPEPEPDRYADIAAAIRAMLEVYAIHHPRPPLDRLSLEARRRFRPWS